MTKTPQLLIVIVCTAQFGATGSLRANARGLYLVYSSNSIYYDHRGPRLSDVVLNQQ
jgi:hypothetical protein